VQLTAATSSGVGLPATNHIPLKNRAVSWTTSDPTVATVSDGPRDADGNATAIVNAQARGTAVITATSEGVTGNSTVTVMGFKQVVAGEHYACALRDDGLAYCW